LKEQFRLAWCKNSRINYFKNLLAIFQEDRRFFQQSFYKILNVRIADILLIQSYLRNIVDFYDMFHFSVEIFLRFLWNISVLSRMCLN